WDPAAFPLENYAKSQLSAPRRGTIRAASRRTASSVRTDEAERAGSGVQAVLIRPATGVVLRIEQIERLELQVTRNALREGKLFHQASIHTIDLIEIQVVNRLERHAAESTAQPV